MMHESAGKQLFSTFEDTSKSSMYWFQQDGAPCHGTTALEWVHWNIIQELKQVVEPAANNLSTAVFETRKRAIINEVFTYN